MAKPKGKIAKAPAGLRFCEDHDDGHGGRGKLLHKDEFFKTLRSNLCKVCRKIRDYGAQMAHFDAVKQVHAARENGENLTVALVQRGNAGGPEVPGIFFDKLGQFFCHTECGTVLEFRGSEGNAVDFFCRIHEMRFTVRRSTLEVMAGLSAESGS
jgi:hypothetical protein